MTEHSAYARVRRAFAAIPDHVTLIGGPEDGRIVEFIGTGYVHIVCPPRLVGHRWAEAHYAWEFQNNDPFASIIGRFTGLYAGGEPEMSTIVDTQTNILGGK